MTNWRTTKTEILTTIQIFVSSTKLSKIIFCQLNKRLKLKIGQYHKSSFCAILSYVYVWKRCKRATFAWASREAECDRIEMNQLLLVLFGWVKAKRQTVMSWIVVSSIHIHSHTYVIYHLVRVREGLVNHHVSSLSFIIIPAFPPLFAPTFPLSTFPHIYPTRSHF